MERVALGSSGIGVSVVGLGCMGMNEFYGVPDDAESAATVHRALELGVNFIDTADCYGRDGANERFLGEVLRGGGGVDRDSFVLATKFGQTRDQATGAWTGVCGTPAYVRSSCDASLSRLGLECIDLYYLHRVDPDVPVEETVGAMSELVAAGKVRAIGLSEAGATTIRRAHAVHPVAALQSEYSIWTRDVEGEILDACRELGIAFVAYSPLGRGMLAGSVPSRASLPADDYRHGTPRFEAVHFDANRALAERIAAIAVEVGCTPAQLCIAWVLGRGRALGQTMIPIPGTKRRRYLEENVAAAGIDVGPEIQARIDTAVPPDAVRGTRYPAGRMGALGR